MDLAAPGNEVKVAIRVRPMLLKEQVAGMKSRWLCTDKMISPDSSQSSSTSYIFDKVFDASVSNKMVYDELASDIVKQAMIGFNGTVFTYGQSGSGKTYTIDALRTFAIKSAYDYIENSPAREFLMRVSYIELYNEKLTDLLSDGNTTLTIREDYDKNVYIDGLQEIIVKSQDHVKNVLAQGNARRTFAETKLNERSSRAHCIFRLVIESRERDDPEHSSVYASYLNLVDLAGSEKAGENSGERLREGVSINLSLLTLSQVIRKLSGEQREFINYRDSKLTRILQNALEGNSKTAILCTVAPFSVEETHSTLRFALNAKKVKTKPQQNEVLTDSAMLKKSQLEIRKLKNKIKELEERNLVQDNDELQRRRAEREVLIKEFSSFLCVSSKAREEKRGFEKKRRETVCVPQLYRSADFKVPGIPMDVPKLTFASAHPKQVESLSIPESPPANDSVFGVSHSLDSPCESQECSYCDLSFTGIEQAIVQESVLQKYTAKIKIYQREISDLNRKLRQRSGMFITSRRDIKKNKSFGSEILHPTFCEEDEEVFASAEEHIQSTNERLGEDVENMDALKAQNVLDQNEVEDLRSQLEALTVKMTQYDEKREESEKNMAELSDRIRRDEEEIKKLKAREEEMALQYEEENKRWKEKVEKLEWERSMQEMMKEEKGLLETTIIDKNEASERDLHEDLEMQKKELLNEWEEVSRLKEELNEQATSIENTLCTIEKDKEKLQKERGRIDREWNELEKSNDDLRKEKEEFDKKQESVESVTERVLAVQEAANPHLGSDGYSNAEMAHVLEKGTFVTSETEDVMSESHVFSPINGRYPENITLQEEKEALLRELDSLRQSVCELNARKCAFESEMANSEKLPKIEHDTDMARQDSSLQEEWKKLTKYQAELSAQEENVERKLDRLCMLEEEKEQFEEEKEQFYREKECLREAEMDLMVVKEAFKQEQSKVYQGLEQDREGNLVNRNQLSQEEERLQEQWEHLRKLQEQFHQEREAFKQEQLPVSQEQEQDREGNLVNRNQLSQEEERLQEQWEHLRKLQEQFHQEREAFKQEQLTVSQEREQDREGNLVNRNQLSQEEERLQEQWEHLRKLQEQFHQEREAFKQEQLTVSQEPEQDREGNKVNRSQLSEEEERLQEQWEHLRKLQEQFNQEREAFKQEQLTVSQEREQDREGNLVNRNQLSQEEERLQEQWEHLRKLQEQFHQEREAFKQEQLTVSQEPEQDREGNKVNRSQLLEEEERLQEQWEHLRKLQEQFNQEREAFKQEQLTVSQEREQDREGNLVNRNQLSQEEERLQEQWEHLRKLQEQFHQEREAFKQEQLTVSQEPEQDREGNKVNRSQLLEEEERLQEQWEHLRKLQEQFHQERESFKQEQLTVSQEPEQDREGNKVNRSQLLEEQERLQEQWEHLRKLQEQFHQEREAFKQEQLTVSQEREQDREGNTVNRSQLLEEEERLQEQWEHLRKLQAQFHQEREAFKQEQLTVSQEPEQDREGNKVNRSQLFKEEERLQEQWEHLRKIQEPFHQEREAFKQEQLISQEPEQDREGNKVNRSQLLEEEERLQEQWEHLRKLQAQFHQEREAFKQEQSHVYQELEQDREGDMVNMNQLLKDEERLHKQWEPLRKLQEQFHQEKEAFEQARAEDQTRETLTRDQETLNSEWYILKQAQNDFRLEKEALEMSKVNVETNYLIGREDIGNVDRLKDKLSQVDDESGIVTATSWDNSSLCCEFKEGSKSMSVCIHEKVEQQWQEKKEESREQGENIRQLQEGMNVNILSETGGERVVQCLETCEESHSFEGKQTWQDVTDNMEQAEQVTKEHGLQYEEEKYTQKTLDQLQTLHDEMGKLQLEKEQLFNEKVILQAEKEQFQEVIDTLQRENKMLKVEKEDPQVDKESHLTARVAMVKTEQQDIDISVENMSLNAHHELRGDVLKDQDFETADLNEPDVLDETVRIQTGLSQSGCDISRYRQVSCHGEDSGEVCDLMTELKTAGFFIHEKKDRFDEEKGSLEGEWEQLKQAREELCSKEVALRDREEDIVQRSDILHKFNLQKEEEQLEMKKEALRIEEERLQKEKEMLEDMKAFLQEEADKLKTDKEVINEKAAVVQEEQARIQREQETLEKKKIDLEEHERLAKDFEERKAMHQKEQEIFQRKQETLEEQTAVLHEEQTILQQEKESFKERNLAFKEQQERLEREKQIIEQNIVLVHEQEARLHKEKGNLEKKIAAFQKEQDEFQIKAQIFEEKGAGLQEMQDRLHKEKEVFEYENMTLQSEKERFQKEKEICEEKNILFQEDQRRCQIEKETLQETIAGLQEQRVRCQKETEMFQEDQRRCQIEKETLQETIASLKEQQVRCQKETEMFQEEKEQLQEEKDRLQEEKERLQEEKERLQEEKERLQEEKDRLQEEKDRLQEEKDRLHETIADLHAGYQKETEILKEGNDKLQEETIRLQKEKDRLHEESVRLHEESVRLQEENIRLQEAKVNFQKMHHEDETRRAAEELQKLEDNLDDAYDKIDRLESLITKGKAILAEKTEAVRQANDKVKELEEAVDALKSNLASLNSILEAKSNECEKLKKVQDSFRTAVREQEGLKKEMEDMVRGRTKDREYYDDTIRQLKLKLRDTQSAETSFLVQRNPPNQCAPTLDQMRKIVEFENAAKFLELKELKQRVQEHEAKITDLENEKLQLQTEIRRLQLLLDNETVKSEAMKSTANQKILAKRKVEEELAQLRKQLGKGDKQNTDETPDEMTKMLRNQLQEKDQLIEQLSESIDNRNRKWVAVSLRHKALIEENHTLQKLATEHQNKMADCAKLPPQGNVVRDSDDGMQKEKQSDVADLLKENSELKACLEKLKLEAHEQTPHKEDHVKQQQKQPSSSAESLHCVRGELSTPTESSHQPQQAQAFSVPSYRSGGGVESFVIAVKDREIRDLKRKLEKQSEALKQVEHNTHASSQKSVGSEVKQQPEEQRHRRFQVNSTDKENIPFGM